MIFHCNSTILVVSFLGKILVPVLAGHKNSALNLAQFLQVSVTIVKLVGSFTFFIPCMCHLYFSLYLIITVYPVSVRLHLKVVDL